MKFVLFENAKRRSTWQLAAGAAAGHAAGGSWQRPPSNLPKTRGRERGKGRKKKEEEKGKGGREGGKGERGEGGKRKKGGNHECISFKESVFKESGGEF